MFLTTFGVIFLAEMGDKTQLAAMTMAAQSKKPWAVLIGASLALACVSAIGVWLEERLDTICRSSGLNAPRQLCSLSLEC